MPKVTIDNKSIEVPHGTALLEVARKLDVDIPTMCYEEGYPYFSSCMMCMVKDLARNRMIPACSALVVADMEIETDSVEVREARKDTLELLLSEHVGNSRVRANGPVPRTSTSPGSTPR